MEKRKNKESKNSRVNKDRMDWNHPGKINFGLLHNFCPYIYLQDPPLRPLNGSHRRGGPLPGGQVLALKPPRIRLGHLI